MECQKEKNMAWCNCSFGCSKQGMCCECVKYHRELGELPACYFSKSAKKTGDRSIAAYLKDKNQ